ncbi:hypothetical protein OHB14_32890 [Streptomyces sp. NBC_01613]|uniref:hypothetical protein n=1 Tax=Streptomyces sp. NBC_01613 TaxID=2975896 RepID=UPI00386CCF09
MNRHLRKATLVTAVITAGLLMTACQHSSTSHGSKSHGSSRHKSVSKRSKSSRSSARRSSGSGRSSSRTVTGGTITYLAPGKYVVSKRGTADRAFFVDDDTLVYGAGVICGNPRSEARPQCTLDQLETAADKAAVTADVIIRRGVATVIRERRDAATPTTAS